MIEEGRGNPVPSQSMNAVLRICSDSYFFRSVLKQKQKERHSFGRRVLELTGRQDFVGLIAGNFVMHSCHLIINHHTRPLDVRGGPRPLFKG